MNTLKICAFTAAIAIGMLSTPAFANNCQGGGVWAEGQCWYPNTEPAPSSNIDNTSAAIAGAIGVGHGGKSNSTATVGDVAGGSVTGSGNSRAQSSANNRNAVSVNTSTRIKHSAASAHAPAVNGYGQANCFGDSSPSGGFSAGISTFEWGVSAGNTKPGNICAVYAVGGPRAAAAYLAAVDNNARRALIDAGVITTPRQQAQGHSIAREPVLRCPETHPVLSYDKSGNARCGRK